MTFDEEIKVENFKFLCEQTKYFNDKFVESFSVFVSTLSLFIGGSIWLATQKDIKVKPEAMNSLSDWIVSLLVVVTLVRMIGNYTAWWGYRKKQHEVYPQIPAPTWPQSAWMEIPMCIAVLLAGIFFWVENPFAVLSSN